MNDVSVARSAVGGRAACDEGSRGTCTSYPAARSAVRSFAYDAGTCQPPWMMTMVGLLDAAMVWCAGRK